VLGDGSGQAGTLKHFNINPVLWGTLVFVNLQAAFLSPPVAMSAFYLKGVGSKRIPGIEIDSNGMAAIDLWCNTMQGRAIVSADAITISTGEKTDRPCAPERAQADDDLAAALAQVTHWRWEGESLVMDGAKELRFRLHTN
jgi:hypothetical protein